MSRALPDKSYDFRFFEMLASGSEKSARVVLPLVFDLVRPATVIDVGCGVGSWAAVAKELGAVGVVGVDGAYVDRSQLQIDPSEFVAYDLRQPLSLPGRFDLALCLEVAEHLPPERGAGLIADLAALSDVVLFSAAIPGQGGRHHTNERWQSAWVDAFAAREFKALDVVRPVIWDDERVEWWYRQNCFLFARGDSADRLRRVPPSPLVDVVHPHLFAQATDRREVIGVRKLAGMVVPAIAASVRHRMDRRR